MPNGTPRPNLFDFRASFIQIRLDVFQGQLDMQVYVYNEGKQNELIGDGVLLLNEVVDRGELDGN